MIEIRAIEEGEASAFLDLLCQIFDLDPGRAATVFYSEPFFDLKRKWALFADGQMQSILTTTPLDFGFGRALGIAGVGTRDGFRGRGYGQRLLEFVLETGEREGEAAAMLFAHQEVLYTRCGFQLVDEVVKGPLDAPCQLPYAGMLPEGQVEQIYAAWSLGDPMRLRRDARRWHYWRYVYRECYAAPGGYVASETNLCREALFDRLPPTWPILPEAEWYGLRSMTDLLGIPMKSRGVELLVMARGFPATPQMFMSDQF